MKTLKLQMLLAFFMLTLVQTVFAQEGLTVIDSTATGSIRFALIEPDSKLKEQSNSIQFLKTILKVNDKTSYYLYRTTTDELGYTHEAYQQTFEGIKVEFAEFIVHRDQNGNITSINGNFEVIPEDFKVNTERSFEETFTRMSLKRNAKQYQILDLPKSVKPQDNLRQNSQTEIVIVRGDNDKYYLAHKANLMGNDLTDNFLGYLDPKTGDIVFKQPLVYQANVTGSAATRYSGIRSIVTDSYSGRFRLREINRGGTTTAIHTRNFNNTSENSQPLGINNATEFNDNDNNWTVAEFNNTRNDNAALDAHWGAEMTFDYFFSEHNHKSYDNNNAAINNYVHVGSNYDNAFWSGTYKSMFYGDGGEMFSPLVSLDVVAHEIGHAISNANVGNGTGLVYRGESGALNESLSDIWAACVENKYAPEKQTWVMGEDISRSGMISMSEPKSFSNPNCYGGDFWANTDPNASDNGGVHTNSGVGNHWFYLLSQGRNGTNDLGNNYSVFGIGILKASKIVYRMETTNKLSSNSGYSSACVAAITAAKELYGNSSIEAISVQNAWDAVGIGTSLPYGGKISAPTIICNNSTGNFTLSNLPLEGTITWTGDSNLTLVSGQGTKTATFKGGTGSGYSTAKATVKVGAQSYDVVSSKVWIGVPETPTIGGSKQLYPNTRSTVVASSTSASTYDWSIVGDAKFYSNSGVNIVTNSSSVDIVPGDGYPGMSSMIRIRCSTTNTCGTSAPGTGQFMFMGGIARMKVDSEEIYDIQVYSFPLGQLMYTEKGVINFNINDAKLSKGVYIIHKTDSEGNMTSEKVMLK